MPSESLSNTKRLPIEKVGLTLGLTLVIVWVALLGLRIWAPTAPYEIDPDEGLNSIKSLLFLRGYALHREVWSDQPPLFTVALGIWMAVFGTDANIGRLLVATLSGALLASLFLISRSGGSTIGGLGAMILLFISNRFAKWSSALMIGLPALTFGVMAMATIAASAGSQRYRRWWLILAGGFLAAGVLTKLFAALLVIPASALVLLNPRIAFRERLKEWLLLGVSSVVILFALILLTAPTLLTTDWPQLILPHLAVQGHRHTTQNWNVIDPILSADWMLISLAGVGALSIVWNWRRVTPPLLWAVVAGLWMVRHQPLWPHHYVLMAIPLAWLGGIALTTLFEVASSQRGRVVTIVAALLLAFVAGRVGYSGYKQLVRTPKNKVKPLNAHVIANMKKYASPSTIVLTDRPIYAFQANLPVVPRYAVVSSKRRRAGRLREDAFERYIKSSQPEQVLLARFKEFAGPAREALDAHYINVYRSPLESLYVRKDLVATAVAPE
jgi:4-amino-4-deoxy-L-arabinose transferase-like glycosyltransferase